MNRCNANLVVSVFASGKMTVGPPVAPKVYCKFGCVSDESNLLNLVVVPILLDFVYKLTVMTPGLGR